MKIKILFIFLLFALKTVAQNTETIRENSVCQAFWQIFESDSLSFEFQNIDNESIGFYSIIHYTDTIVNMKACGDINDFDIEPYIIQKHRFDCQDISKMIFYYEEKRIKKISFYIEIYDDNGNYQEEQFLFFVIYKVK